MKALRGILCVMLILCFFAIPIGASQTENQENTEEVFDFKEYFTEKLLPIGVGILTAGCGLFSSLASIKKALSSLKEEKESLSKRDKERDKLLQGERQQIKDFTEQAQAQLQASINTNQGIKDIQQLTLRLAMEIDLLSQAIGIVAFKDEEMVRSGKGKRLYALLEESKNLHTQLEKRLAEYQGEQE
ncbi:MAG: hypothetical protein IJ400_02545 [Clostridia bacterium]|nr:hypothetical protein [Clostridia bacterium]